MIGGVESEETERKNRKDFFCVEKKGVLKLVATDTVHVAYIVAYIVFLSLSLMITIKEENLGISRFQLPCIANLVLRES